MDAKVGEADFNGYHFNLVDLPGTYSLSAYSPEELYVRKQLIELSLIHIYATVEADLRTTSVGSAAAANCEW